MIPRPQKNLDKLFVIIPASFMNSLGIGTLSLGILFVVKDLYHAGPALVGSLGAAFSMSYFLGCIVLRSFARRFLPRTSMTIMLLGSSFLLTGFLVWPGLWQAFAAYSLYGFLTAFFWPPVMGWLSKGLEGADLGRATSLFSVSWSVGGIFSSYMAGLLSEMGKMLPVIVTILLFLTNAVFIWLSRSFVRDDSSDTGARRATETPVDRSTPLRYPAWLGAFLVYLVMGVVVNVFPVFARDELRMSESSVGLVLTVRSATTALGFFIMGRLTSWHFNRSLLPSLSLAVALALSLLVFQKTTMGFIVSFGVVGLLQAAVYTNSLFYATSGAPDRDKRASIHEALLTFGQVTGSISGGLLYQAFSMPVVFIALAAALLGGMAAQSFMISRGPRSAFFVNRRS
jgi:DHA1 family multidrug resistance protein-like MFS transporter/DHA1 family quinolone resistance protein-like MFS transporter